MKIYEFGFKYHWWIHSLGVKKQNKQNQRIIWKMIGNHDSLYTEDKIKEWGLRGI